MEPLPARVPPLRGDGALRNRLRGLVGRQVRLDTVQGTLEGTLLSCTSRSAWVVDGDVDHVVALPLLRAVDGG